MQAPEAIDFHELTKSASGFPKLFADYLGNFADLQPFFPTDFHDVKSYHALAQKIAGQFPHREEIASILLEQNQRYSASRTTIENIELLRLPNTLAIVTGQQVGMLTGPLYTPLKTITAIKLAEHLKAVYPEFNFVPVFWLEGEDHDFGEMNKATTLNAEGLPTAVEFLYEGKPLERNIGAVGQVTFSNDINVFVEQFAATLPKTEFKENLLTLVRACYREGNTMQSAFAEMLGALFPDDGLVFMNPNDRRFKLLMQPIFRKEIDQFPAVSQMVISWSAELESHWHAQIKPKAVNLFLFHKGGRYLIEPREHDFSLKGTRQYFTKEELLRMVEETPELFSPNVALRPICQDIALPTLAYVGGPSEISYFAQLSPVYKHFGVTMPIIYPRASATLLEERLEKTMAKYELTLTDVFDTPATVNQKVIDLISEVKVDDLFTNVSTRMHELLNEMQFGLNYIDPTLVGSLDNTRGKIDGNIQVLRDKATEAQKRRHETALRQVGRVINTVFPNGNYQERELNILHFMNKYGPEFVKVLKNELKIDLLQHQIIRL